MMGLTHGVMLAAAAATVSAPPMPGGSQMAAVPLVWHAETLDGRVLESHHADVPLNPASVVKVATSLWAMEALGPEHRFETRFHARGALLPERRELAGDLVVRGDGDPDFHVENAFLVARALAEAGVDTVRGSLVVTDRVWIGWEGGSAGTSSDPRRRALRMAHRLRQAMDAMRWDPAVGRAWDDFVERHDLPRTPRPRIRIAGGVAYEADPGGGELLVVHRSKPLPHALRRFNCYSNNDIERVGSILGDAQDLAHRLRQWEPTGPPIQLSTTSGLGENRLSPRQVVHLLRAFRRSLADHGLGVESLLPVAGCDPGTVAQSFPRLAEGSVATSVAAKTGTLVNTDGGVAVLAGYANTGEGEVLFCVAAPGAGRHLDLARREEQRWVLGLLHAQGGARPRSCAPPLPAPDDGAQVEVVVPPRR